MLIYSAFIGIRPAITLPFKCLGSVQIFVSFLSFLKETDRLLQLFFNLALAFGNVEVFSSNLL